ncbi:23S rRNA (pseudouridine1915-N3)-methyltransferase, putative [Geotalea daltonii FRC-32]|uniref:Ribosomal RNA large subunit methyltransferase H n=1 Tax=Geotalea daltonii (strain DSM 22248 / JCM 15807 / FRC-32) TaxID=316067 RepID=RLMH_GEODF|nr:23S rRNA (pseudouridine(1915)-N(3))-methyltransferase RlmH [Geotalea daltonii]B9M0D9.1 RecName: Full=Ribosomal RNA large subunit methyltransferase H; AltName: Full=23S rRNA (pseudouridine1915-N3)-methyltransferase; AltName: Full=23S rRNA m3Psi1915 methyltransferase; AltName: Full=rRNA (pseudouridine-N3-)-methyltransferase RlmH [Geotalea daltonii FRC-32]ACM18976.1 23S rRNA (pseudouridine1915-N3)-methyltransferase, putative [Geotalea daltonii FRC-32]
MRLKVLWVGKTQEEWVRRGIDEYAGRIGRYMSIDLAEARDEKGAAVEAMREREGERLLKLLPKNARLVLLDERGEQMSSPELARFLATNRDGGTQELVFVIGGAYGFSDSLRAKAFKTISLSRMTFTHQMVRIFLLEQLYRGFTIINGEPYHH